MKPCTICNKELLQYWSRKFQCCRNCYDKKRKAEYLKKDYFLVCKGCEQKIHYTKLDNRKLMLCHNCYEKNRRHILIEKAKKNPEQRKQLKEYYRRSYLKVKAGGFYKSLSRRISSALNRARKADPVYDLNSEWYYNTIVNKNCYYCNIDEFTAKRVTGQLLNIDRLIPSEGYKQSNCVPACKACNTAKLNIWSPEETKELGKLIAQFYKKRV